MVRGIRIKEGIQPVIAFDQFLPGQIFNPDIGKLDHRLKRTLNTGQLHSKYSACVSRRELNQLVSEARCYANQESTVVSVLNHKQTVIRRKTACQSYFNGNRLQYSKRKRKDVFI